jgi:hypothetical protein
MTAATIRLSRTRQGAATLAVASSSVAPVAYGYDRSLRPSDGGVSRLSSTIQSGGDR